MFRSAILCVLMMLGPVAAAAEEIIVFAAASMKPALDHIAARFEQESGHEVIIAYAGSNLLARQIVDGAPAALFLSAAESWMDVVEEAGMVAARRDLLRNRLVLVAGAEADLPRHVDLAARSDLRAWLGDGWLSMAMIDAVPAGQYGKAALAHFGLWDGVADRVAQADNVRGALAFVASGAARLGVVYASDARAEPRVRVLAEFPETSHPPAIYPAARLRGASAAAEAFYAALFTAQTREILTEAGFAPP